MKTLTRAFTLEGQLEELAESSNKRVRFQNKRIGAVVINTKEAARILRESSVVLTTCAGAGGPDLAEQRFPVLLVDEATQVREELLLLGLSHGVERLVMTTGTSGQPQTPALALRGPAECTGAGAAGLLVQPVVRGRSLLLPGHSVQDAPRHSGLPLSRVL